MLSSRGFDPGAVDGVDGQRTRSALAAFQAARGLPQTAGVTPDAYVQLRRDRIGAQATQGPSQQPGGSVEQAEARRRAELSRNDPLVTFRRRCDGLFIPEVRQQNFRGAVPVFVIRVLNNSNNRYRVTYDVTFSERANNYYGAYGGDTTLERNFVSRPGSFTEFILERDNSGTGQGITGVRRIVVLNCEQT